METVVLTGIGIVAFGYVVYVAWRAINSKAACGCGSGGSCREANGSCRDKSRSLPK